MEISNIVRKLNPENFSELIFYHPFGTAQTNFKEMVKPRSLEDIGFVEDLGLVRGWIDIKSKYRTMKNLPEGVFQLFEEVVARKNSLNKSNPFKRYYIDKMIQKLLIKF